MRIGIFGGGDGDLGRITDTAAEAAEEGFSSFWVPQIFGYDALTVLALVGREVPGIELGTSVIPTYPRHPIVLAAQAVTTQLATGGRLSLGIGLSHQFVIESMFGYSFAKPVRHMKEYLTALIPLMRGESVSVSGETLSCNAGLSVKADPPPPVLVAALGTQMLRLTGSMADGTITWMTGPATLAEHTAPTLRAAAADAGRPEPRVVAGLPVCVTDDPEAARDRAGKIFAIYGQLPSYRAMLDREGAGGPGDVAIVGNEEAVAAGIGRMADAGVTEYMAAEFGSNDDERKRTRALLQTLL